MKSRVLIGITLLFFANTNCMEAPQLKTNLQTLQKSLTQLKSKIETLQNKLSTLKEQLGKESIFVINDKTKFVGEKDVFPIQIELDNESILLVSPSDMGFTKKLQYLCIDDKGPLGKYDTLEINIENSKSIDDASIKLYKYTYMDNIYGITIGDLYLRKNNDSSMDEFRNTEEEEKLAHTDKKLKKIKITKAPGLWDLYLYKLDALESVEIGDCEKLEFLTIKQCPKLTADKITNKPDKLKIEWK